MVYIRRASSMVMHSSGPYWIPVKTDLLRIASRMPYRQS